MEMTMKQTLTALVFSVALAATPALVFSINASTITPTISFPDPAPQTVTQGTANPLK
jgi:hypothetical protein